MASTQQTTGAHHTEAATSPVSAPATLQTASGELTEDEKIRKGAVELVEGIINPETREESLSKLGRNREKIPDLVKKKKKEKIYTHTHTHTEEKHTDRKIIKSHRNAHSTNFC